MWYVINYNILKKILLIFVMSLLTFLICTPLRALPPIGAHINILYISAPIGFVLYYILVYQLLKRYSESIRPCVILTVIISAFIIIQLPPRITDLNSSAFTLPEQFIHLLGILSGYVSYQRYIKKWITIIIGVVCYIVLLPLLFPLYCDYLNYGSTTTKAENTDLHNFRIINEVKDTLTLQELKGDYIILDLWYRQCPSCIKSLPKVQSLYHKTVSRKKLSVYAVNYPIDDTDPFQFMQERGFDIPVLQLLNEEKDSVTKKMGIHVYPTTIILDKRRQIVFKGSIEMATKYVDESLK